MRASTTELEARGAPAPAAGPDRDIVVVTDLRKSYGDSEVLRGVSMRARRGETTVLMGGSGAGKTTLLRLLVALEPPTSGSILIDGEEMVGLAECALGRLRRKLGMVYQYAALLDSLTVMENVAFPLVEHTSLSKKAIRARVIAQLEKLGLSASIVGLLPSQLSGGMRKRVGIARALMLDPPIIIYDEPTSGLDPPMSRTVDDLIEEVRERCGVTSIVSTHDIASCFRIAHQVILMMGGAIVASGTPDDLANSADERVRGFIASSGVDLGHLSRVPSGIFPRPAGSAEGGAVVSAVA